ncbi:MAG TPA: hypothetical protein PL193_07710 [Xanthobacteraceae bacterium]|nr:hypothetical protein [Xanthobacteraceae bacterium]
MTGLMARDSRQKVAMAWACRAFTPQVARNAIERAQRFFEEAGELAQACGLSRAQCDAILDRVFARPKGSAEKEFGDVGLTLLTLAEAEGYSADECEARQLAAAQAKPDAHWRARQNAKAKSGLGQEVPA